MVKIAPSILSADFARLGEAIARVEAAGADWIHLDVMDGHFVPNLTIGMPVVRSLRPVTRLFFDVHLMIEAPDRYVEEFAAAGADAITVHVEADRHLHRTLACIRGLGKAAGVSLNPATPIESLTEVIGMVDLVLLMSVNPGFGGQEFIPAAYDRLRRLRELARRSGHELLIAVDGGVDAGRARRLVEAGADVLVAGSAVFHSADPGAAVRALRAAAEGR